MSDWQWGYALCRWLAHISTFLRCMTVSVKILHPSTKTTHNQRFMLTFLYKYSRLVYEHVHLVHKNTGPMLADN